jgi:hypothetical protein
MELRYRGTNYQYGANFDVLFGGKETGYRFYPYAKNSPFGAAQGKPGRLWSTKTKQFLTMQRPNRWNGKRFVWAVRINNRRWNLDWDKLIKLAGAPTVEAPRGAMTFRQAVNAAEAKAAAPTNLGQLLRDALNRGIVTRGATTMFKDKFIVGSINKATGVWSISSSPALHDSLYMAQREALRLAAINTDKKFVVLRVSGIAASQNVVWE